MLEEIHQGNNMGIMDRVRSGDYSHLLPKPPEFARRKMSNVGDKKKKDDGPNCKNSQLCNVGGKKYCIAKGKTCGGKQKKQVETPKAKAAAAGVKKEADKVKQAGSFKGAIGGLKNGKQYDVTPEMAAFAQKMGVSDRQLANGRVPKSVQADLIKEFDRLSGSTPGKPKADANKQADRQKQVEQATKDGQDLIKRLNPSQMSYKRLDAMAGLVTDLGFDPPTQKDLDTAAAKARKNGAAEPDVAWIKDIKDPEQARLTLGMLASQDGGLYGELNRRKQTEEDEIEARLIREMKNPPKSSNSDNEGLVSRQKQIEQAKKASAGLISRLAPGKMSDKRLDAMAGLAVELGSKTTVSREDIDSAITQARKDGATESDIAWLKNIKDPEEARITMGLVASQSGGLFNEASRRRQAKDAEMEAQFLREMRGSK